MEYVVVLLAGLAAFAAVLDSRLLDPYFAFYEIVPGMGIGDAAIAGNSRVRAAIVRRFGYGVILGIVIAVAGASELGHAIAAGIVVTVLLLWPMAIHGVPRGKLRSDWMLVVLYAAVLAGYVGAVIAGQQFFFLVAKGDVASWIRDQALTVVVTGVLLALAFGIFDRWLPKVSDRGT